MKSFRGSLARRNEKMPCPSVPHERRGQAERRVVLGLQPQLEHELRPAPDSPLVEVQAQLPRGRRAACERADAVVHPARQLPLQRRDSPECGGRSDSAAVEPFEEELERGRTARLPAEKLTWSARSRSRAI